MFRQGQDQLKLIDEVNLESSKNKQIIHHIEILNENLSFAFLFFYSICQAKHNI